MQCLPTGLKQPSTEQNIFSAPIAIEKITNSKKKKKSNQQTKRIEIRTETINLKLKGFFFKHTDAV